MTRIYVAIDFDGTMVTHSYPDIGSDIGAWSWIKKMQDMPYVRIILNTMRSGEYLGQAVDTCLRNGIKLFGINTNPTQSDWTVSNKPYAHIYIDDAALGCPLIVPTVERAYVDWAKAGPMALEAITRMIEDYDRGK